MRALYYIRFSFDRFARREYRHLARLSVFTPFSRRQPPTLRSMTIYHLSVINHTVFPFSFCSSEKDVGDKKEKEKKKGE